MKFEDAYSKYLVYVSLKQKKQSIRSLKERFNSIIIPYFKDFDVFNIKQSDYLAFISFLDNKDYSYNYKRNIHYLMCSFYNYLVIFLGVSINIPKVVGGFKKEFNKCSTDFYTLSEFNKFIKFVDDDVYRQFFIFMFFTGCRPGETMALKFSDLKNSFISINKTIDEHGNREVSSPKTFKSNRIIEIDKKLYKSLLKLKKYYIKKYNIIDFDYYIFGGIKPLAPTTINRKKVNACKLANIKVIRLHDFRHSHATLLVNKKIMINEVSRRLGHSNVSTTLNTYVHTNREQEKRVIKTLNFLRL